MHVADFEVQPISELLLFGQALRDFNKRWALIDAGDVTEHVAPGGARARHDASAGTNFECLRICRQAEFRGVVYKQVRKHLVSTATLEPLDQALNHGRFELVDKPMRVAG